MTHTVIFKKTLHQVCSVWVRWTSCPTPRPWLTARAGLWGSVTRPIYHVHEQNEKENPDRWANYQRVKNKKLPIGITYENFLSPVTAGATEKGGFSLRISQMPSERQGTLESLNWVPLMAKRAQSRQDRSLSTAGNTEILPFRRNAFLGRELLRISGTDLSPSIIFTSCLYLPGH